MNPTLQEQLGEMRQHDLLLEADQRRLSRQVARIHPSIAWIGNLFLTLGNALVEQSGVQRPAGTRPCLGNRSGASVVQVVRQNGASPLSPHPFHCIPASATPCSYASLSYSRTGEASCEELPEQLAGVTAGQVKCDTVEVLPHPAPRS